MRGAFGLVWSALLRKEFSRLRLAGIVVGVTTLVLMACSLCTAQFQPQDSWPVPSWTTLNKPRLYDDRFGTSDSLYLPNQLLW